MATRLINADVPQHIVQQLLDHMSPEMTAVYARLHLDTVRRHWESAVKVNADGNPADLPEGHPLATAQWIRLSMVRAKVTLPTGYCGAPVQTDCEYANPAWTAVSSSPPRTSSPSTASSARKPAR